MTKTSSNVKTLSKSKTVAKPVAKTKAKTEPKKVEPKEGREVIHLSRTHMVTRAEENGSKFMNVTFIKKDGVERTIHCVRSKKGTTKLGYLNVWSVTKSDSGFKSIDPRTLVAINLEKVTLMAQEYVEPIEEPKAKTVKDKTVKAKTVKAKVTSKVPKVSSKVKETETKAKVKKSVKSTKTGI